MMLHSISLRPPAVRWQKVTRAQWKFFFICSIVFLSYLSGYINTPTGPIYTSTFQNVVRERERAVLSEMDGEREKEWGFLAEEIISQKVTPTPTITVVPPKEWGKAVQIGEATWTIKVGEDERAGTADEIFSALNAYRQKRGVGSLSWDGKLAEFANSRASTFSSLQKTDAHAGFRDYIHNQKGFEQLGFGSVGENSSFGYKVYGVHLIEWVYAGDKPHDDNQISPQWTHVGIGVNGLATDLIFAGNKF